MKQKTVAFQSKANNLFFHILTACNLRCRHCYIRPDQHGKATLPIRTIEKWLTLFSKGKEASNVIFLGGEPTLHPDLSKAVKIARDLGYASITIDSNGFLFHDFLNRVKPAEVDFLSFSLDGATRETADAIRGEGVFEICTKNARKAAEKGFSTSLIYTVSEKNIHELEKMPPLLLDLGIRRFFIQVLGIRGNSVNDPEQRQVTYSVWNERIPKVAKEVAALGIGVTWPKVFLEEEDPFECAGLVAENFFVFPNGRVYRCPLCEDYPIHSLEIRENCLQAMPGLNEKDFFPLNVPEGCVMNRLVQPKNIAYGKDGKPLCRIACCLLKEEILP